MRRGSRLVTGLVLVAVVLLCGPAAADGRTPLLVSRLRDPDFRVRTSAALALGATSDEAAITPLCQSLADENAAVRSAAAVALGRLGRPSATGCMRARIGSETNPTVKLELTRAVEVLEKGAASAPGSGSGSGSAPKMVPNAKFYVAISKVTNQTSRAQADVERVVIEAMRTKLESLSRYQIAPAVETPEAARAVIAKRGLRGYYLSITVERFSYSASGLRVTLQLAVLDYPGKRLRGQAPTSATMPGVTTPSPAMEERALAMVAAHAAELFAQGSW